MDLKFVAIQAARPAWCATIKTVIQGSEVCFTKSSFCSGVYRLRRCTPVMTSIRLALTDLISVLICVFLLHILRNTRFTTYQGVTSTGAKSSFRKRKWLPKKSAS
jgi:hypothetical protein